MPHVRPSIADKRRAFHRLHQDGCFVLPNPWDVGSARYLQTLGFKALATTSSGFAWSHGHRDGGMSRDRVLDHLTEMVEATDLPINADFEHGFAPDAAGSRRECPPRRRNRCGGPVDRRLDRGPLQTAIRFRYRHRTHARGPQGHRKAGSDTMLIGRAECFLVGRPDIAETIARLQGYANAGADCLYAPGIRTVEEIAAVVAAVGPKPVNLLIGFNADLSMPQIAALGVRRVSVGGALARAAWGGFMRAAKMIIEQGKFDAFADAASGSALNTVFRGG